MLQKSIEYIQQVQQQKKRQEEELALLRKEVIALQIMRGNYEQLVKMHQSQTQDKEKTFVPSEVKFQAFQLLMDKLFVSFNEQVTRKKIPFLLSHFHLNPKLLAIVCCSSLEGIFVL